MMLVAEGHGLRLGHPHFRVVAAPRNPPHEQAQRDGDTQEPEQRGSNEEIRRRGKDGGQNTISLRMAGTGKPTLTRAINTVPMRLVALLRSRSPGIIPQAGDQGCNVLLQCKMIDRQAAAKRIASCGADL